MRVRNTPEYQAAMKRLIEKRRVRREEKERLKKVMSESAGVQSIVPVKTIEEEIVEAEVIETFTDSVTKEGKK